MGPVMIPEVSQDFARSRSASHDRLDDHGQAVSLISTQIARALGLPVEVRVRLRLAACLHDVGKRWISRKILDKPGPLDSVEWVEMRRHPILGEQFLLEAGLHDVAPWVRSHHERPDGSGYPDGLRGPEIPIQSRILAVADAYHAMISDRPYCRAMPLAAARTELEAKSGTQFDRDVVTAFLALGDELAASKPWPSRRT